MNLEAVATALQTASSRNYAEAQTATNQLQDWERVPGFYSELQELFLHPQLPPELRLVALLGLKNGVEKHWRRGSANALRTEEQAHIRSRLLPNLFNVTGDRRFISIQALVVARIARTDFPDLWPSFFSEITQLLESPENREEGCIDALLTTIRCAIKEFGTLSLQKPKKALHEACPLLYDALRRHYLTTWDAAPNSTVPAQYFRCLRRLSVIGFDAPHRDPQVAEVWRSSHDNLQRMLDSISQRSTDVPNGIAGNMGQLVKFHLALAVMHPVSFGLMDRVSELILLYWERACGFRDSQRRSTNDPFAEFFCLKALLVLRACFKISFAPLATIRYPGNRDLPDQAKRIVKSQVLEAEHFVPRLFDGLVSKFLLYVPGDVEESLDEAEEWEIRESDLDDAYETSSRPCAERLLMDTTLHYKEVVTPRLLNLVKEYAGSQDIFAKDAVYAALGATAPMIQEAFDFNAFLTQQLTKDLKDRGPHQSLLRRRIAILLAQWTPIGVSNDNKVLVYSMFVALLDSTNPLNDPVVRITAGKRFKAVGDEFDFQPAAFVRHASPIFSSIVGLVQEVAIPETQLALLGSLKIVVERMESLVLPFADQVIALLAPLWQELEKEQEMKKAVLDVLHMLVRSLGPQSTPLQPLLLPIVRTALQPGSVTQLYLLEDALALLVDLVAQATTSTPELLCLIPMLLPILELETALCSEALDILDGLLLLDPQALLQQDTRQQTLRSLCALTSVRANELVLSTIRYVEHLIRTAHTIQGDDGTMSLAEDLVSCGFIRIALDCVHGCYAAHQTTGPKGKEPPSDARNETYYFIILARLIMSGNQCFTAIVQSWCQDKGRDFNSAISHILTEWFSHIDNVGDPARTKLMCLALTQILGVGEPWILCKLQDLIALWTSQVLELRDGPDDTTGDSLVYPAPDADTYGTQRTSPQEIREAKLTFADPVHTINTTQFVRHHLLGIIAQCGGEEAFRESWLLNVDADVVRSFEEAGIMH